MEAKYSSQPIFDEQSIKKWHTVLMYYKFRQLLLFILSTLQAEHYRVNLFLIILKSNNNIRYGRDRLINFVNCLFMFVCLTASNTHWHLINTTNFKYTWKGFWKFIFMIFRKMSRFYILVRVRCNLLTNFTGLLPLTVWYFN